MRKIILVNYSTSREIQYVQFSISFQLFDSQNPCSRPESSQKNELCCAITKVVEAKVSTTEIQFKTSNTINFNKHVC